VDPEESRHERVQKATGGSGFAGYKPCVWARLADADRAALSPVTGTK